MRLRADQVFAGLALLICAVGIARGAATVRADLLWGTAVASLLYGLSLWQGPAAPKGAGRLATTLYWLAFAALAPALAMRQVFGEANISAALTHMQLGLGTGSFGGEMLMAGAGVLLWAIPAHALLRCIAARRWGGSVSLAAAVGLVLVNPIAAYAVYRTSAQFGAEEIVAEYRAPQVTGVPARRMNLVIVYLESLEQTYGDAQFGVAYAPLAALGARGLVFDNIDQIAMTDYSAGGLAASLCGVPLFPQGLMRRNRPPTGGAFLPGATCLGDLLAAQGYRQSYVVNSDPGFAGIDLLFLTHGFDEVIGLDDLAPRAGGELTDWGVQDDVVFDAARERIAALHEAGTPFAVVVETMGPHGPKGYLAPECREPGQGAEAEDMLLAVACTAGLARDFVNSLNDLIAAGDTLVVLLSDHLAHPTVNTYAALEALERRNTMIVLGGDLSPGRVSAPGAMIDVFPTVLELMGFQLAESRAGLGRSLRSAEPTLAARLGVAELNRRLLRENALRARLWRAPVDPPLELARP
ncbi:sulfatase-like hydrolase/transferase [Oceanicola sp. 502str15]|uniref:sulfatase-like hydrolase/transferase n=1 Tax=Oceanicola sp. 502str15 TaxID=2696061 RepID=UPI0020949222|nr:sulfatase-like hydrolase/transferase [Oceanicola sp. 502str15]MCO6382776.1 sulfatase-like hydrolase/transferase [Oceanicola sp. 502str15]